MVGTGDFNADAMADIVWRDTVGNTAIWLMNGASILSTGGIGNVPTNWTMAQTGDFDGDGKSDLLWRDTAGDTSIWFMSGCRWRRPGMSATFRRYECCRPQVPIDRTRANPCGSGSRSWIA
jgi:hypothetical protein